MFIVTLWYRPWKEDGYQTSEEYDTEEQALQVAKEWQQKYSKDYRISVEARALFVDIGTGTDDPVDERRKQDFL